MAVPIVKLDKNEAISRLTKSRVFFGGDQFSISTPEKIEAAGGIANDAIFSTSSLSIIFFLVFGVVLVDSLVDFIN